MGHPYVIMLKLVMHVYNKMYLKFIISSVIITSFFLISG